MPRVTLAKLRKRARDQQRKKEVAASCRSQTVYTAPGPAERIDRVAGPFIKGNDGEDDEVTGERGGVVLRAAPEDGGAVILQRLSQSSHSQLVRFKRDAKELRLLKETLQEELEAREEEHDLELDNDALALGLRVRDVESMPPSDRKGENMTANPTRATTVPTKEWQFTSSHLLAQKESNDFLAALRAVTYSYVDFLEPLFLDELRSVLGKREAGLQRLKKTVGEEQMRFLDGCAWTGIRILEEGSRTAWQAYGDGR
ncbi:hypothetical protein BDZ90DRAFT_231876 [Jaminaea rosea]|uniref:Uncharacterized protein n=1 Tax=Jaminaea rosea TaxID=1569628 RepID=A0A316US34_9BASI|nr:hypothetical protein BDZ90DRAFT_231876 [Jaminaea rosea]PWN28119.1 hypothetical protein BDZ90DRAFT_231876 [Jaminaea rosea]